MKTTVGFIGAGNMAEALMAGMLKDGFPRNALSASDRDRSRLKRTGGKLKIRTLSTNSEIAKNCGVLVLATKPQDLSQVLSEISPDLKNQLLISIAAGIDTETLRKISKSPGRKSALKIVRAMPNNPALIGQGITALFSKDRLSPGERRTVEAVFQGSGDLIWVKKESWLDAVTGLSGSGPAYLYSFVRALSEGGRRVGLPSDLAERLALKTTLGAALTLEKTRKSPSELIPLVTSKKGTTLAGLQVMKKAGFERIMAQTVKAAARRARQIRMEMKKA